MMDTALRNTPMKKKRIGDHPSSRRAVSSCDPYIAFILTRTSATELPTEEIMDIKLV
jgi:hypothetical protein